MGGLVNFMCYILLGIKYSAMNVVLLSAMAPIISDIIAVKLTSTIVTLK